MHKDLYGRSSRALLAQFFGGLGHVAGHRFTQLGQGLHRHTKAARRHDLLLGRGHVFQRQTRHSAQLAAGARHHHAKLRLHVGRQLAAQVEHAVHAHGLQAQSDAPPDAPDLSHVGLRHPGQAFGLAQRVQVAHAVKSRVLFGQVVGELGQGLGRADAGAHRQPRPLPDAFAHALAHGNTAAVVPQHGLDAQEALVDAVDLDVGGEVAQDADDAVAHVAVQRVVGRQRQNAVRGGQLFHLEPGRAHLHAQGLDLGAAGHRATVVVGQHDHGHAGQPGLKDPLATHIKVIDIDQRELRRGRHGGGRGHAQPRVVRRRTTPTTTPQISSSAPSAKVMGV